MNTDGAMRVIHLINRPQMRGAEMFAVRIAVHLERWGLHNALCSLYHSTSRSDQFDTGDLRVYELNVKPTLLDSVTHVDPVVLLRLRRVLRDFRPDIIVGHGSDTLKYTALGGLFHRRSRTVYKNIGTASYWANTTARVWFNKLWLRGIDCTVSVSDFTRKDFVRHYGFPESRSVFIPNAIEVEDFSEVDSPNVREQVRREIGLREGDVAVAMVGSLSPGKGQDHLIEAVSTLSARGLPVKLVLVGDGPERGRLERLAQTSGVAEKTHFLGLRKDVPRVLAGADVFALASASEGMPGVLIEAGLSGLPSVAYDVGGVREVLRHRSTGLIVRAGDSEGLVEALAGLCADSERRLELGKRAKAWCRSQFDITSVAQQYEQLFRQLLSDGVPFHTSKAADTTDDTVS